VPGNDEVVFGCGQQATGNGRKKVDNAGTLSKKATRRRMKTLSTILRVLAHAWVAVAGLIILTGTVWIAVQDGVLEALWLFSPFNIWNFALVVALLLPAVVLLEISKKIAP